MSNAVSCPHCGQPLAHLPELVGKQVGCPHCRRPLTMPTLQSEVPSPPLASAGTAPMVEDVVIDTSRYRPRFRPRDYWGLRAVQMLYYMLAVLCLLGFVAGECVIIAGMINTAGAASEPPPKRRPPRTPPAEPDREAVSIEDLLEAQRNSAPVSRPDRATAVISTLVMIAWQFFLILCLAIPGVIFVAAGQLIGLLIDVQANTEEAAHHLRYLSR